jgi:ABC-2 type transport system ATP-binding protein
METFVLDIDQPLDQLPQLPQHELRLVDECTLEADICRGNPVNALFTDLSEKGINVLSMRNKANRLEQLFVNLLEDNGNGGVRP